MSARQELLRRAARCYMACDREEDACRCYDDAGDYRQAAGLHETAGRLESAAGAYRRAEAWRDAARCYSRCARPAEAAECLRLAGEYLGAAWLLADAAGRFDHARAIALELTPEAPSEQLAQTLVLIRCDAGNGNRRAAAARLARCLAAADTRFDDSRYLDWALACTRQLHRPDLAAALFSRSRHGGAPPPEMLQRWENWATATLGDNAVVSPAD